MNKRQIQRIDQLGRIIQQLAEHSITPTIPRATVLIAALKAAHSELLHHGSGQTGGQNIYRSGASQRQALRKEILFILNEISDTAKALDPADHPGVRDLFRQNKPSNSYQRLVNTASSFLNHLASGELKTLFTERGFAADFDTQLAAKLSALAAATGIKHQGRQQQKLGTVGLDALNRRATLIVRELSAIMVKHLRNTKPMLVPVWKTTARLHRVAVNPPANRADIAGEHSRNEESAPIAAAATKALELHAGAPAHIPDGGLHDAKQRNIGTFESGGRHIPGPPGSSLARRRGAE